MSAALLAILNPVAGNCNTTTLTEHLSAAAERAGRRLTLHRTTGEDDFGHLLADAAHAGHRVIVAGGDGTVAAVASALPDPDRELAIVPVGTANKLARELGLPLQPEAACELAVSGTAVRRIDAMRCDGQLYFCHIALGLYARVARRTPATAKQRWRRIAYVWNALALLRRRERWSWRFTLNIDGRAHRLRAAFVMVTNIADVGAGDLRWGPDIAPDDGRLDLCIVRARNLRDYAALSWALIRHRHRRAPRLRYLQAARRIEIDCRPWAPIQADGEALEALPLRIDVLPARLTVVVPEMI